MKEYLENGLDRKFLLAAVFKENLTHALPPFLFNRSPNASPAVLEITYRCCGVGFFWRGGRGGGPLLCLPVQTHCVTVWCNPSMNAAPQRRMSRQQRERWWKLCQWFTWLLCRFTSCTVSCFHDHRCFAACVSARLVHTVLYPCMHMCIKGRWFYFFFVCLF